MRINRFFSDQGICSRREADRWVEEGRIKINGKVAVLGDQVADGDHLLLDNKPLKLDQKKPVILAFNKPTGVECTSDPRVEGNIIDVVNYPERVFHVGRLDMMSEGLILLTNRGEIVNKILRRRYGHEKEYIVVFDKPILDGAIKKWRQGIELEDGKTSPCKIERMGGRRIRIVLKEGRNRQIRRMAEASGLRVLRLKRIRVMNIELGNLRRGRWRLLTENEESTLLDQLGELREVWES